MQLHLSLDPEPALVRIRDRLRTAFGPMLAFRRRDPVSQLVRSSLGGLTNDAVSETVFAALRARFSPWTKLADARLDEVLSITSPVTHAPDKSRRLVQALRLIGKEAGALRLDFLQHWPLEEAMAWLQALPGVGQNGAASVLNFSTLSRGVLVVDGHVLRVLGRLGLCDGQDADACREAAMDQAPDAWTGADFLELHANLKRLGQALCRAGAPECPDCPLNDLCPRPAQDWLGRTETQGVAANENKPETLTPQAQLDAYLSRRLARLERDGISAQALLHPGVTLGRPELDGAFLGGRLPAGAHQSAGTGMEDGATALGLPLAVIAGALRLKAHGRVLVVQEADALREHGELHGPGLEALGLDPHRWAFARARDGPQALEAADEALRRRAVAAVVVELRRGARLLDLSVTRRFNLMARRAGLFLFLVTPDLSGASAAATRWRAASVGSQARRRRLGPPTFHLELVRNRSGRTASWIVEWSAHEHRFLSARPVPAAADRGAAVPAPVGAESLHRPGAA